jgi:DNA-3-methyladenine glycosylase
VDLGAILVGPPEKAAPRILGAILESDVDGRFVSVRIDEVEAYKGEDDSASHAYRGRTERNGSMFQRPGTLYVYRSYGVHWCANVAAGPEGTGWGILFRGGVVVQGVGIARDRRGRPHDLADGPGKLCQALGITGDHNGSFLLDGSSPIRMRQGDSPRLVVATPRVGISSAADRPWRFVTAVGGAPTT